MEMTEQIEETVRQVGARVRPQIDPARRRLTSLHPDAPGAITQTPGRSRLGALALGFLIGTSARRA
jgi:hypothetical protein